ncbi:Fc.00g087930.m01.CDS01 [Cosmosporella sp. VM-42]
MESSALVKAHDHARAAAVATRQASDTTVAINEHTHAAGEFASAARSTSSVEALRTLKLLEEHHRKLAEILKIPSEPTSQSDEADQTEKPQAEKEQSTSQDAHPKKDAAVEAVSPRSAQKPGLAPQRRYASREMSSSIASNLASARGIRSKYRGQPVAPSISNDQAPGNLDPLSRQHGPQSKMQNIIDHQPGKPAWVPPGQSQPQQESRSNATSSPRVEPSPSIADDGGYTRFYSTFGSLINKISAPLAFAGLPLIQEESTIPEEPVSPETSPKRNRVPKASPSRISEPDLSKIYSRATMKALARDGHGPQDSFYVVPKTGHTMSYANILSFAEKEKRRLGSPGHGSLVDGIEDEDDDFVDARETPVPLSPEVRRRIGRARSDRDLSNTIEELYTENKSLKDMLDKLTKRLHAFEASAQNSAMALAESFRLMRPGSPASSVKSNDDALRRKNQEMEEQLAAALKQMERLEKDNRKMQKTLEKYREKWEVLKAGAKARREAQGAGDSMEDTAAQS